MVVIADSDCIRKLAYCNFLTEFLQLLQVPPNDIWVLPAVSFQLRRKLEPCPEALADFEKFFSKTRSIPKATSLMLSRFESLDAGEQQIFALLCEIERVEVVVTGDKKAINRVAVLIHKDPSLGKLMEDSTVLCFEAIVLRLIEKRGFSMVNARMALWRQRQGVAMDKAMNATFAIGCTEHSVSVALNSSIDALSASCVGVPVQRCP